MRTTKMLQKQLRKFVVFTTKVSLLNGEFSKFRSGDTSLKNELKPERLSDLDQDALMESAWKYLRISTWTRHISIHNLLQIEKYWKSKQVGCLEFLILLSDKIKEDRMFISTSLLSREINDLLLKNITGDEKLVL